MARDGSSPIGGFTSTETTKRPRAIFAASSLRCASGGGWIDAGGTAGSATVTSTIAGLVVGGPRSRASPAAPAIRAAAAMRRMCSGVVPQQPPTSRTPTRIMRRA